MEQDANKTNRPVAEAIGLFTVSMILIVTIGLYAQLSAIIPGIIITEILLILLPALCFIGLKKLRIAETIRLNKISVGVTVRSIMLGVSAWGAAVLLGYVSEKIIGPAPPSGDWMKILYPSKIAELPLYLLAMAMLPGICEEILFRGAIQGTLEGKGLWKGLLLTSFLFALFHLDPWGILPIFFLGIILGLATIRTNSIIPAMIVHTCNNATAMVVGYFGNKDTHQIIIIAACLSFIFVAVFIEYLFRTKYNLYKPPMLAASMHPIPHKVVRGVLGTIGISIVLIVVLAVTFLGRYRMTSDVLDPEVKNGDLVVTLKSGLIDLKIESGNIVAFKIEDGVMLRKVQRVDNEYVFVVKPDGDVRKIVRRDIIGKVIYVAHLKKW